MERHISLPVTKKYRLYSQSPGKETHLKHSCLAPALAGARARACARLQSPHFSLVALHRKFACRKAEPPWTSASLPWQPLRYLMCTMGSFNLVQLFESVFESPWLSESHHNGFSEKRCDSKVRIIAAARKDVGCQIAQLSFKCWIIYSDSCLSLIIAGKPCWERVIGSIKHSIKVRKSWIFLLRDTNSYFWRIKKFIY